MGRGLPDGVAEERAAERKRKTFSGENYQTYDPEVEGYGSYEEWAAMAAAFVNGDVQFEIEDDTITEPTKPANTKKKKNANPNLAVLDLDEMPINLVGLKKGYRSSVMAAFRAAESNDTSPDYVNAFSKITRAFEMIKRQKGW
jgi:hypothetical protein